MSAIKNPSPSAKAQLDGFLAKFYDKLARSSKAVIARMRKICPGANELVYDNYNALAIGFSTSERVKDVWFSIAIYPRWASLFFFGTLPLKDPSGRLKGKGSTTKHIVLADGAATFDQADVAALIAQALKKAGQPFQGGRGKLVIKSISAKQRPRRPG